MGDSTGMRPAVSWAGAPAAWTVACGTGSIAAWGIRACADRRRIRRFVVRWVEATKIEEALRA